MTATHTEPDLGTVVHLPPGDVLLDVNARTEAVFDPDRDEEDARFLANVRAIGVLTPVVARHDPVTGKPLVIAGQRRTLAARTAGLPTIPVYVVPDDVGDADRLAAQVAENQARKGHGDADLARAYAQLAAFGLDQATIATRTGETPARVEAALTVTRSATAAAALHEHTLTIEQALTLAEFEDDPAAVERLTRTLDVDPDRLDHVVEQLRDARAYAADLAAARERVAALGVPEVEWKPSWERRSWVSLVDLAHPADGNTGPMTVDAHADCPGRAVVIEPRVYDPEAARNRPRVVHVCDRPHLYGHQARAQANSRAVELKPEPGSPEAEAATQERRAVRANNTAMDAAMKVRRRWLREFLARTKPPADAAAFVARHLGARHWSLVRGLEKTGMLAELLGLPGGDARAHHGRLVARAGAGRALMLAVALIAAGYEEMLERDSWRLKDSPADLRRDYLAALAGWGYTLAEVEELALTAPAAEDDQAPAEDDEPEDDEPVCDDECGGCSCHVGNSAPCVHCTGNHDRIDT